jgi:NADH-quinone oxidoreductase subunit L
MAFGGIGLAYFAYVARPGLTGRLRSRTEGVHGFLQHKWYFDEAIDLLVYRPVIRAGQFANSVIERVVVDGIVTATSGAAREMSLLVRGAQSGFVRAYALLVLGGLAVLALYFLVVRN